MPTTAASSIDALDPLKASPEPADHGRGVHTTWLYTLGSIVFVVVALSALLIAMAGQLFVWNPSVLDGALLAGLFVSAATQVRYAWFLRRGLGGGLPALRWNIALIAPAALVWLLGLFEPAIGAVSAVPLWMALCLASALLASKQRLAVLLAGILIVFAHSYVSTLLGVTPMPYSNDSFWLLVFYCAMFPIMVLSSLWWWQVVVKLDQYRRAAADLAVTQERLRFAADLHDIQGHHLQVIALKSELAERLLTVDPETAREHVHETRMIAKQALEETRSLVSGYRVVSLDDELQNAREVLSAAGVTCTLELDELPAGTDLRRALALMVREATTNILRHSEATHASIQFRATSEAYILSISNDGVAVAPGSQLPRTTGTGLAGLRERFAPVGGELTNILDADAAQFTLAVRVPTRVGARA